MGLLVNRLPGRTVTVGLNVVAAAGFVMLTLTSQRWLGLTLAAIVLAGSAWRINRAASNETSSRETISAQIIILLALVIDYVGSVPGSGSAPFVVVAIGLGSMIINQPLLDFLIVVPPIRTAHLPGYSARPITRLSPARLQLADLGLIGLVGVASIAKINPRVVTVITLALLAATGVTAVQAYRSRRNRRAEDRRLRKALVALDPQFVFYFSTSPNSEHQVAMWYPYLRRLGLPFAIILREKAALPVVSAMVDVPVLYCDRDTALEQVITPSMKACFYAANGSKNSHMVRFRNLTHIQLLHGDSDKISSYNPFTAIYDRIFVAGQAGIDRYGANGVIIPAQKFDIVGRPQIENVEVSTTKISNISTKVVLYATTWAGSYASPNYCSLHLGEQIVRGLLDAGATVILRPHPYARRQPETAAHLDRLEELLADDEARTGRKHRYGKAASEAMSLLDCINAADALVSDVSGVASDWLFSEKPFALTNTRGEDQRTFEKAFPLARAAYILDRDASNLNEVLSQLLKIDSLADTRRACKTYYLGDFPAANYGDEFVNAARKYVVGSPS